ncbi:transcription termination factor Rho [Lachnoanaerobaculum saburreum]|uniref:Transcription termination factor Rho n=1 Tax=Lachnoanaerobaculum saburreum TaxID=467210 RepID=A0A133ZDL4_9FIRM|nr:transcription termination factor Rho [Lachnoanaerobaculum saburreum]KXB53529.1 transcription termination factor Rho [Lachnoanaerobaculum saburreum]
MKEKLQTLSLVQLKEIAREQGFKGVSNLNKANLIDLLVEFSENQNKPIAKSEGGSSEVATRENSYQRDNYQSQNGYSNQNNYSSQNNYSNQGGYANQSGYSNQNRNTYHSTQRNNVMNQGRTTGYNNSYQQRYNNQPGNNQGNTPNYYNNQNQYGNQYNNQYSNQYQNQYGSNQYQNQYQNQQGYRNDYYDQYSRYQRDRDYTTDMRDLESGEIAEGILEIMPDGFGFIRCENFLPGDNDVYVSPAQIKKFGLRTGDVVSGMKKIKTATEKFAALLYINTVNSTPVDELGERPNFEDLTPVFPDVRIHLATNETKSKAMRIVDLLAPIGKGQRGMIVAQPKAGKTTLLKEIAKSIIANEKDMHLMIVLIDERPEEVTDIKEAIVGDNVEVIYSTFDEVPERHKRVSEMVIERAKRLVEQGKDVMILLDSITRLARAYNLTVAPSGRTLSGGLDPAALHMPKRFFGAARNIREGGSLTILATALVDTGSRMDDVVFEEFKGTGNMEIVLNRKLSEKRIFPAIDVLKSSTRRDDLLLSEREALAVNAMRKATENMRPEDSAEQIIQKFASTNNNEELVEDVIAHIEE